ncbi:hypothetical protein ACFYO1_13525 [Nocardia sp. NPDC006044]|uniref:hypothetical protein n=1 Tax=Nocardia sp. NPDC006044 TaxID=3364306 RepID=UPI0036B13111
MTTLNLPDKRSALDVPTELLWAGGFAAGAEFGGYLVADECYVMDFVAAVVGSFDT